jgi:hypothetical protein
MSQNADLEIRRRAELLTSNTWRLMKDVQKWERAVKRTKRDLAQARAVLAQAEGKR